MASKKKGILSRAPAPVAWHKHFKKWGKRLFWKTERRAEKSDLTKRKDEVE